MESNPSGWFILGFLSIFALVYFIPSILGRKDKHFIKIFALNLLGGWSGILWLAAMVWATFFKTPKDINDPFWRNRVFQLARSHGGTISAIEAATELKLPIDDAKRLLDHLCVDGIAELKLTESGHMVYAFHGLSLGCKRSGSSLFKS